MIHHDSRCDRRHTPRQRCNRALGPMTPADDRLVKLGATVAEPPAPRPLAEPEPEPGLPPAEALEPELNRNLINEAVATAGLSVLSAQLANESVAGPEPSLVHDAIAMSDPHAPHPSAVEPEPEPSLVREALATSEPPEPTVFVLREWDATADAVERAHRPPAPVTRAVPQNDSSMTAALIGAAVAIVVWLLVMRGHRGAPD